MCCFCVKSQASVLNWRFAIYNKLERIGCSPLLFQTYCPTTVRRFAVSLVDGLCAIGSLTLYLKERLQMGGLRHG
jgi:hypothetical protein